MKGLNALKKHMTIFRDVSQSTILSFYLSLDITLKLPTFWLERLSFRRVDYIRTYCALYRYDNIVLLRNVFYIVDGLTFVWLLARFDSTTFVLVVTLLLDRIQCVEQYFDRHACVCSRISKINDNYMLDVCDTRLHVS